MKKLFLLLIALVLVITGCGNTSTTAEEIPEVTDRAIEQAYGVIKGYDGVLDAFVNVDNGTIILAIQVDSSVNEEYAKDLADSFTRSLAAGMSDLRSPGKDDLGGLYDYYNLQVGVGTSADNFIIQGAKVKTSPHITY